MNPLYIALPIFAGLVWLVAFWVVRHDKKALNQRAQESAKNRKKSKHPT
jgi:hypothetical protein